MGILAAIQLISSSVASGGRSRGGLLCCARKLVGRSWLSLYGLVGGLFGGLVGVLTVAVWATPAISAISASSADDAAVGRGRFANRTSNSDHGKLSEDFEIRKGQIRSGGRAQALLRWQGVRALLDQRELSLDFVDTQLRPLKGSLPYYQVSLDARGRRLLLSFPGLGLAVDESIFRREVARLKLVGVPWSAAGLRVDPADSTLVIWLEIGEAANMAEATGARDATDSILRLREVESGLRIVLSPAKAVTQARVSQQRTENSFAEKSKDDRSKNEERP